MNFWDIYDQRYSSIRRFIETTVKDEWVAEDLVQETFIRVQNNLHSLKDESKLSSWIFSIAYHLCQDHFRKAGRTGDLEYVDEIHVEADDALSAQDALEQGEMGRCVQGLVDMIPDPLRTVLVLYDVMGFRHREIAEIMGISAENAKVRLHRARKKMKTLLEKKCSFEIDGRNVLTCEPIQAGPRTHGDATLCRGDCATGACEPRNG